MSAAQIGASLLGYLIVFGSGILKVPQILAIVRNKSADGVSLTGHLMETFGYCVSLSWGISRGLKFSDFGESTFVFAQLIVLNLLIGFYTRQLPLAALGCAFFGALTYALAVRIVPIAAHELLFSAQILFTISSRVPQIYLNYKKRSVGQLSFITCFLAFGGTAARLLTTFISVSWDQGKAVMLLQFTTAALLNGILLLQFVFYGYVPIVSPLLAKLFPGSFTGKKSSGKAVAGGKTAPAGAAAGTSSGVGSTTTDGGVTRRKPKNVTARREA